MGSANERRRYYVMPSLIGWAHTRMISILVDSCDIFAYIPQDYFTGIGAMVQFPEEYYINGLVQDCCNSIANALELLQLCSKPLICKPK